MMIGRRDILAGATAAALLPAIGPAATPSSIRVRARVIIDNDFSGDPDGLFQLAHHALSESVDIPLIIGTHLNAKDRFDPSTRQASNAADKAREVLALLGPAGKRRVIAGSEIAMTSPSVPATSPASDAIIAEAMRTDTPHPLYYVAGASLTEIATAWLKEPRIGPRITLVWIGGMEYDRSRTDAEYNSRLDLASVQTVFNQSDINIWQVPRDVYRQLLVSYAELEENLAGAGRLGKLLMGRIDYMNNLSRNAAPPRNRGNGETYILGDSPLVTVTALQSSFEPDSSSSFYAIRPQLTIDDRGFYGPERPGRTLRAYRTIDTRLTFDDMWSKFRKARRL